MSAVVTLEHWPVVFTRLSESFTEEDLRVLEGAFQRAFDRGDPFVALLDARGLTQLPGARERRLIADWMKRIEPQMKAHNLGSANVFGSKAMRGVMTAINWIFTPPVPQEYPATALEGLAWCEARLEAGGVDKGGGVESLRRALAQGA